MSAATDRQHMAHALHLAARGLGQVWPNPAVGCVIVQGDRIVGRGWTQPTGRPHAERVALDQAGGAARGATAFVTLEPCAHHGKTPPCADALIAAGVGRVVSALTDPDPRVSGQGHGRLRAAGIDVTEGVMESEARHLNRGFLSRVTRGLPLVTLKLATTLDGRIATATGESRWITGDAARRTVHLLRMTHDAVMVGSGTARADDPDLRVRDMGATHQPLRIVLDRQLAHDASSRLGQTAGEAPVWLVHGIAALERIAQWSATGARLFPVAEVDGALDLHAALAALADAGVTRVLCEGGGRIAAALLRAGLVDDLVQFAAGRVIGADGVAAVGPLSLPRLADAPGFALRDVQAIGPDTVAFWQAIR